ncbi:major facilitator superfamily domain-containing protein [Emericellopsis atlantica]|uniref:Major facilitator superfamily domain-containing protein n=1 Tax=Emericellopsis atlantica TaxID=2614577 RepID=A0A9P7ZH70_9HYPO|nr:major facilitator superfamily domain-containing protein [Emericellopsis atlantica]KAG9251752.1 major facilitator superfamily domain-containing protein [Emericellopsis atlantica]
MAPSNAHVPEHTSESLSSDRNQGPHDETERDEQTPLLRDSSPSKRKTDHGDEPKVRLSAFRVAAVAFSLWLLIFLQASNMSGITVIQGAIAADLDAYDDTAWFTTAYLIAMSSLAPLAGKLAAVFSPRSLIIPVAMLVAIGTIISAHALSFEAFVLGRVVTGMGGAGVLTLAIILMLDLTSKKTRGVALGMVNAGFSIGVSLGGIVYGAVLPAVGWRALFWLQSPVAVLAGTMLFLSLPASFTKPSEISVFRRLRRIDYLGAVLLILTIVLFLFGLGGGAIKILPLALSPVALILFVLVENFVAPDPVIPLQVLKSRAVLLSCVAQLGLMSARWTVLYYAPIFMLAVRGTPRAEAGAVLVPTNVAFASGGLIVGYLHIRRNGSFWLPCVVAIMLFSISMFALSSVATAGFHLAALVASVIAGGVATGAALNYTLAHMLHHSHEGTQYITTSLIGTFRGFGGAFGTSIGGGIFSRYLRSSLSEGFRLLDGTDVLDPERRRLVSRLLGAPELVWQGGLGAADKDVAIQAYAGATRGVWQAAAILGIVVCVLQAGTGWRGPAPAAVMDQAEAQANVLENEGTEEV